MSIHPVLRTLYRRPGLALSAIAMLAIGIGANTAIYSVVYYLIIQPVPVEHPQRLVQVLKTREDLGFFIIPSWAEVQAFRKATQFEALQAYRSYELTSMRGDLPEFVTAVKVSSDFFDFVNTAPQLGRPILETDTLPGTDAVVLISDRVWQTRFGGRPDILGKTLELSGERYEIVGVMPFGFRFPSEAADCWIPLVVDPQEPPDALNVMAELAPGVSIEQAKAELDGILAGLGDRDGTTWTAQLFTLGDFMGERTQRALWLLFLAVGLVLVIACVNAANLILIQGNSRSAEMAIRNALGARRRHLAGRVLLESTLLGVAGGLAGVALAYWGIDWIRALRPQGLEGLAGVRIDRPILIFSFLLSFLTGLGAGLVPALKISRPDIARSLRSITSGHTPSGHRRFRTLLVTLEMALCTLLLMGAGMLVRSFAQMNSADPGYNAAGLLSVRLSLPLERYSSIELRQDFFRRAIDLSRGMPGVQEATLGLGLPSMMGVTGGTLEIEGRGPVSSPPSFAGTFAASDYFRVTGIPLLAGRSFADEKEKNVIIVNREMAQRYFEGQEAVGRRIRFGAKDEWTTIVGVVGNVRAFGLADATDRIQLYSPFAEIDPRSATMILRTNGDAAGIAAQVPGWITSLDSRLPVREISSAERLLSQTIARERFSTLLFSLFAAVGVALAGVGLYGVVSYLVQERTREFGIRMALGACRRQILRLVLLNGMALSLGGVVLGLLGSYWFNQAVTSQLTTARAFDPWAALAATTILFAVAASAAALPASRATRVDPNRALRVE